MFGFGLSEIVITIVVILVLINPEDLPGITRKTGKIYGSVIKQINVIRKSLRNFEDEI